MDNSIYVALSKQAVQFRKMGIIANNVANMNTHGFKKDAMMLTDWSIDNGHREKVSFAQDLRMYRDYRSGSMQRTDNELDIAVEGQGFLVVETPAGPRYTRAGQLSLDATGALMNAEGLPVLTPNGERIVIPPEARSIDFNEDGTIMVDRELFSELNLVEFDNPQALRRENGTLYNAQGEAANPAQNSRIVPRLLGNIQCSGRGRNYRYGGDIT